MPRVHLAGRFRELAIHSGLALVPFVLAASFPITLCAQGTRADYERAESLRERTRDRVERARLGAHWFDDSRQLWYRVDLGDERRRFLRVDVREGERRAAFDHERLATALGEALARSIDADRLPLDLLNFEDDGKTLRFNAARKGWRCELESYELVESDLLEEPDRGSRRDRRRGRRFAGRGGRGEAPSPDGQWVAFTRDHNVHVKSADGDVTFSLSEEGTAEDGYIDRFYWSPDATRLIALRRAPEQERRVYYIESSPDDQLQPKLDSRQYLKPGDRIAITKPHLFDIASRSEIPIDDELFANPWRIRSIRWQPNSRRFTFRYNQRGHQVLRVLAVDASTGEVGVLIEDRSETFIDYAHKTYEHQLEDTNEIIWMSERDGWCHLYLHDARTGQIKNQITRGEWVVRRVDRVDEESRQIWFRAGGIYPEQDPYYIHFCRIDLDGSNLVILTEGNGTHDIFFSPDRKHFIDRYSRVDMPPVHELRRSEDGALVCELERADASALLETGWRAPERFVAKGRDGETDIHGVIYRPSNFDPERTYPVIEKIYAGPQGSFVPKSFRSYYRAQALCELGFIVVQIDGMGTSNRSKAFHDVCWKNLRDAGFPDRILWMQAAAKKYPYMDLSRVGLFGGSAGGQNAMAGLLHHGDFYKVGVADCGCHDNRMDKIWWNELWMGWPVDESYKESSNVTHAHRLEGKLMLTVGELDTNVDPASTLQVVDALIEAGKDFDFILVPGAGHGVGSGSPYLVRRRRDFFVRHLHGVEPRREAATEKEVAVTEAERETEGEGEGKVETESESESESEPESEPE